MKCDECEQLMSDYMENTLNPSERDVLTLHLNSCRACTDLLASMREVVAWGKSFQAFEAPAWLPARIVANTPVVARERWIDTLVSIGRWIIEPRTALAMVLLTLSTRAVLYFRACTWMAWRCGGHFSGLGSRCS